MAIITFDLHDNIKNALLISNNMKELSKNLNIHPRDLTNMLEDYRRDIINKNDETEFYIIEIIDIIITPFAMSDNYKNIIDQLKNDKSIEVIAKNMRTHPTYCLYAIKKIYAYIFLYGSEEDKLFLPMLKDKIGYYDLYFASKISKEKLIYKNDEKAIFAKSKKESVESNSIVKNVIDLGNMNSIRFISYSDTHFGNIDENIDYSFYMYEYAANNNIVYLFNSGDFIHGNILNYSDCKKEYSSAEAQIEHVLRDFPYDNSIKNYILLGNHDLTLLTKEGIDFYDSLFERKDFIPLGYKMAYLKCNKEYIELKHKIDKVLNTCLEDEAFLTLAGHSHMYSFGHSERTAFARIPTLSNAHPDNGKINNIGFLDIELFFENGSCVLIKSKYIDLEKDCSKSLLLKN